jgi:hypothetical protein
MSPSFLLRSASLSRSRKSSASSVSAEFVPFSWTLFVLAVFHFSVWSLGVACPGVTGYFAAHTCSLKTCDQSCQSASVQDLLIAQQQAEEHIRASQQAIRLIREREASHTHGSAAIGQQLAQTRLSETSLFATQLATLVFLTAFTGAGQSSEADGAANNQQLISV